MRLSLRVSVVGQDTVQAVVGTLFGKERVKGEVVACVQ